MSLESGREGSERPVLGIVHDRSEEFELDFSDGGYSHPTECLSRPPIQASVDRFRALGVGGILGDGSL